MHTWFLRKHVIKLPVSQPLTVQQLRTFLTVFAAKAAPAADVGRGGRRAGGGRGWSCWGSSASGEWRDLVGAWAAQKNILNLGFIMVLHLGLISKDLWNQQHRNRAGWLCTKVASPLLRYSGKHNSGVVHVCRGTCYEKTIKNCLALPP